MRLTAQRTAGEAEIAGPAAGIALLWFLFYLAVLAS